ncbi:MAG: B12-binding domain-containing radical SAM protein [Nitrospirales bacterium]|nr:B12-binding domain-containing radical SAM protein [Nitrospirales bacterium]
MPLNKPEITFISPYEDITAYSVRLLSAVLREQGYPTRIIFAPSILEEGGADRESLEKLAGEIQQVAAGSSLIGFSFFSCHLPFVAALSREVKRRMSTPLIWGGKHITAQPDDAAGCADLVCIGEGEFSLPALLDAVGKGEDSSSLAGIWPVRKGAVMKGGIATIVQDLDSLPFPDFSMEGHYVWDNHTLVELTTPLMEEHIRRNCRDKALYYQTMASRGCSYCCSYCYHFKDLYKEQHYVRKRSNEKVIEEVRSMLEKFPFFEEVCLSDDNFFSLGEEQLREFAVLYREKVGKPLRCLAHPHEISREKLALLTGAGLRELQVGVQTGSRKTLKLYRRGPSPERVLEAVAIVNEFKDLLMPYYDFIIDNPYEEREDVLDTLRLITRFPRPYRLNVFSLTFFPGTELHRKALQDGRIADSTKTWQFSGKSYVNFLFLHILTRSFPRWFTRLLLSKPVVALLDHKPVVSFLYSLKGLFRKTLHRK